MLWIIAAVVAAIVALTVLSATVHLLFFSPWLWVLAIGALVWLRARRRRSRW
jgi:hypothetical protein